VNPEPKWRVLLYWGTVITFFTLPLLIFVIHLMLIGFPEILHGHGQGHVGEFKYVFEFHRTLAALVFGLAGLHTGEVIATTKRVDRSETPVSRRAN
jgi:hypothetical protein